MEFMRRPELAQDARFAVAASRARHAEALDREVEAWTAGQDADTAAQALQSNGVAAHVSWTTRDIADDPHLRERGAIAPVSEPDGSTRAAVTVPIRFSRNQGVGIARGTPALGEDEDYVFGELLGLCRAERERLAAARIIY